MYDYLIIGAGLSGSTFADMAKKAGRKVCVFEKKDNVCGCLHQYKSNGITVHECGPHIFHTNKKMIWDYINEFDEFNGYINQPIANVCGELYNLPFNMNTFMKIWGCKTPSEAEKKIEEDRIIFENPQNLEEYALSTVGRTIYEMFVEKYTRKQWGKDCKELPADFIKRIPIRLTYDNNYFNSKYQGIPINGYNKIIEKQLDGCDVYLNTDHTNIKNVKYKKLIYTAALDELFEYCFGALDWRSLRFETFVLDVQNHQGCAVMNYNWEEKYTRIIEHKHFLGEKSNKTILTKEYPEEWSLGKERYYPIQNLKNIKLQKKYLTLLDDKTYPLGRLGQYKYINMDQTIEEAINLFYEIESME